MAAAIASAAEVSAHRRDEYLQAARLGIDTDAVRLELDLTPGIALADAIVADLDRDRDGAMSLEEQRVYVQRVVHGLALSVDGVPLQVRPDASSFPGAPAMRRGEGTIRLQAVAPLPRLSSGVHQLSFRNRHDPDRSVYLANALVPDSDRVAIAAQRRDERQTELTIEYVLRPAAPRSSAAWLLGGLVAAAAFSGLLLRPLRSSGGAS